jgi:cytochrome c oxidase assembly factor CtaG
MIAHMVAAAVWVGGLAGIVICLRGDAELLARGVRRFSVVALGCFTVVAVTGAASAWIRLGEPSRLWTTPYGLLVIGKIAALVALGGFGLRHRRATVAALVEGRSRRPFLRLAVGEIAVMAATIGLAVALSRTAPPTPPDENMTWVEYQLGYDLLPFTMDQLVTRWRPDPLVASLLAAAGIAYAAGARRLSRRGVAWPRGCRFAWFAGLGVLALVLLTGVASYARGTFSAHAVQYAAVTLVAPALLAYGDPGRLRAVVRQPRLQVVAPAVEGRAAAGFWWWTAEPIAVVSGYAVLSVLFHFTEWFVLAQQYHPVRLVTQSVLLAVGFRFFGLVLPNGVGSMRDRRRLLAAGLAVHVSLTGVLLAGPLLAEEWYRQLGLMWAPPSSGGQVVDGRGGAGLADGSGGLLADGSGGLLAESAALVADQRLGALIGLLAALAVFAVILRSVRPDRAVPAQGRPVSG